MMILTTGGMEVFSKYLGTFGTFSLICCMFWIFSPAEGSHMSEVVGTRVVLPCVNKSVGNLTQLTWKKDGVAQLTLLVQTRYNISPEAPNLNTHGPLHISREAHRLNINMSVSESQQYALIIERAQTNHMGNYSCEISTANGNRVQQWELIITDPAGDENWHIIVIAVVVPCVCVLILIIALASMHRVWKWCAENRGHSPTAEMGPTEHIYENHLEIEARQQRGYNQHNKPRAS